MTAKMPPKAPKSLTPRDLARLVAQTGATLAIGGLGGLAARALGLPLPLLLGSLLTVAGLALAGWRPLGWVPSLPPRLRLCFMPVIGVAIGGAFTPQLLRDAPAWGYSLAALILYIPVVHLLGFRALLASGRVDRVTAFFGAVPGGLIESVQMGEERGADPALLVLLQFMRLILTIILVPIGFSLATGHAVGSAGGVQMAGADVPLGLADAAVLLGAGSLGAVLGLRLRLPAGAISGPILLSGLAHLAGLVQAIPPGWLIGATQVVIGCSLGIRFVGKRPAMLVLGLRLALVNVLISMALAGLIGLALAPVVGESAAAVFLAFAPGGLTEMSLIALSLQASLVYVSLHHVLRIVLSVTMASAMAPWLAAPAPAPHGGAPKRRD